MIHTVAFHSSIVAHDTPLSLPMINHCHGKVSTIVAWYTLSRMIYLAFQECNYMISTVCQTCGRTLAMLYETVVMKRIEIHSVLVIITEPLYFFLFFVMEFCYPVILYSGS